MNLVNNVAGTVEHVVLARMLFASTQRGGWKADTHQSPIMYMIIQMRTVTILVSLILWIYEKYSALRAAQDCLTGCRLESPVLDDPGWTEMI